MSARPSAIRRRLQEHGSNALWTLLDHGMSSVTNVALSSVVARSVSKNDFGEFALVFMLYGFALGAARAMFSSVFMVRHNTPGTDDFRDDIARITGSVMVAAGAMSAVLAIAGLAIGGTPRVLLWYLALFLPLLLLQDAWRFSFFIEGRAGLALANDLIWAAVMALGVAVLAITGLMTTGRLLVVWAIGAATGAVVAVIHRNIRPSVRGMVAWLRSHRDLWPNFLAEYGFNQGALQIGFFGVNAVAGASAVGSVRGAQLLTGPVAILIGSLGAFVIPRMTRRTDWSSNALMKIAAAVTLVGASTALVWGAILLSIPRSLGLRILGETWSGAREVMLSQVLLMVGLAVLTGPFLVLRSIGWARSTSVISLVTAPLFAIGAIVGARLNGALGAGWGLAIAQLSAVPFFFVTLWYAIRFRGRVISPNRPANFDLTLAQVD